MHPVKCLYPAILSLYLNEGQHPWFQVYFPCGLRRNADGNIDQDEKLALNNGLAGAGNPLQISHTGTLETLEISRYSF